MALPTTLTLEERREFCNNYDKLCALLGADLVDEGLMRYSVMSLVEEYQVPLKDAYGRWRRDHEPYHKAKRDLGIRRGYYRFVNQQGWEKSVDVPLHCWMVPHQYQHNDMARHIIRPALLKRYPWLSSFRLNIYSIHFYNDKAGDFYVKLGTYYWKGGFDSLYVPYEAFMAGDVAAIEKRCEEYFTDYTKDPGVWRRMKLDPTVIRFLELTKENAK